MWLWLTLIVVGILTYLQRLLFLGSGDDRPGDTLLRRGLRFVPASAGGLIVPDLLVGRRLPTAGQRAAYCGPNRHRRRLAHAQYSVDAVIWYGTRSLEALVAL